MRFSDEGIIIDAKKYGENSLIVKIFSRNHGVYRGFVRFAKSPKTAMLYQIGNLVSFEFHSRLEENLGSFSAVDLLRSYCSKIMFEQLKLNCVNSIFSMLHELFAERENHEIFFTELQNFLQKITDEKVSDKDVVAEYIKLELEVLRSLGYGIDLSSCVVTNSNVDLAFVSPKSARAVSFSVGKNYEKKLLKLPNFLTEKNAKYDEDHLLSGLELSGFFLKKFLFEEKKSGGAFHRENILKSLKE